MAKKAAKKKAAGRKKVARKTTSRTATRKTAKKTTTRKTAKKTAKKTTKKAPARAAAKPAKITAAGKNRTKSETFGIIADHVGISKKEVAAVFDTMSTMIEADLSKRGPGTFNVPGLMKVVVQRKAAVPRRKGINPFTGEETMFKAKPARNVVKVRPLKGLKDLV
ncbi:MAG: HU family DNA-binding protein [Planctomycetota bacterium]